MKNKKILKTIAKHSGKIPLFLLRVMLEMGAVTIDAFLNPTYSYEVINYKRLWDEMNFDEGNQKVGLQKLKPRSISTALQRLQKQGLVTHEEKHWSLSKEGKKIVKSFFDLRLKYGKHKLPEKDQIIRIVIFDVPEKEREKRDWIRGELLYHEYEPLQKSVWIGYRPLLPQFIQNVDYMNLSKCVQIFSVKNEGTINS